MHFCAGVNHYTKSVHGFVFSLSQFGMMPMGLAKCDTLCKGRAKRTPLDDGGVVTADTPKKLVFFFEHFVVSKIMCNFAPEQYKLIEV